MIYFTQDHCLWMYYFIIPGLIVIDVMIPLKIVVLSMINQFRIDKIKNQKVLLNEQEMDQIIQESNLNIYSDQFLN
ncbi:unnamed protein product [Paramecium primaurelia]|uniref:Transmembrane protein n=1 Tax=Paramecium primaurelia TaxID=5886 RepID=A0A8S1QPK5_PARPR|nr:unnamed protein product [Paramecium primaurelia]